MNFRHLLGCDTIVLRLPSYRCCLNSIELVWHQLKSQVLRQNVLQLIKESCDEITGEHWSNYVEHVMNEELRFRERDNFLDNEIVSCSGLNR